MPFASIEEAARDFGAGRVVVVVGDLVRAAGKIEPETCRLVRERGPSKPA